MANEKNVHDNHRVRLRDRFAREGALSFEVHELLELFLFSVIPRSNTNPTAHMLLDRFGSLDGVFTAPYDELIKINGIGDKAARYIIDSYKEFCADTEEKFKERPLTDFDSASNYLIWHKRVSRRETETDKYITVILLGAGFEVLDVYDSISFDADNIKSCMKSAGADKVILGVYPGFDPSNTETLVHSEVTLTDVIEICDFDAKSLLE